MVGRTEQVNAKSVLDSHRSVTEGALCRIMAIQGTEFTGLDEIE